jgi:squalene-hopene/tetraprenyl-beta-curcumene cyclase
MDLFHRLSFLGSIFALACAVAAGKAADDKPVQVAKLKPDSPSEALAKKFSLGKAADYLDTQSVAWIREHRCGSCHTTFPYLMARPTVKDKLTPAAKEVRKFFEDSVANWDSGKKENKPRYDAEVVAIAASLAINDARTTGKLHPMTRKALDRIWTLQKADGAWDWRKCNWPPFELDDYYGATFAAVGLSMAPDGYADTAKAKEGLAKLRAYFKKTPAPNLHHKAWLMWASLKLDGLMTKDERQQTIKDLLALQRSDGGWSLASLAEWKGVDGRVNDKNGPSDGYGTGLVLYVLHEAGVQPKEQAIKDGVTWLRKHQRESGRWFTHSLNSDHHHYISHAGSAFAVMALRSCDVKD